MHLTTPLVWMRRAPFLQRCFSILPPCTSDHAEAHSLMKGMNRLDLHCRDSLSLCRIQTLMEQKKQGWKCAVDQTAAVMMHHTSMRSARMRPVQPNRPASLQSLRPSATITQRDATNLRSRYGRDQVLSTPFMHMQYLCWLLRALQISGRF